MCLFFHDWKIRYLANITFTISGLVTFFKKEEQSATIELKVCEKCRKKKAIAHFPDHKMKLDPIFFAKCFKQMENEK